jgi:hypothetical protein
VRLVPVGKPTFPDQQQDLQNAAEFRITSECDGSVKTLDSSWKPILGRFGCRTGFGSVGAFQILKIAFVTT